MANNLCMSEEALEAYHARMRQEQNWIWNPYANTPARPAIQAVEYGMTSGRPAAGAQSIKNSVGYGGPWRE